MGSGEVVAEFFESNEPRSLKGKEAQESGTERSTGPGQDRRKIKRNQYTKKSLILAQDER